MNVERMFRLHIDEIAKVDVGKIKANVYMQTIISVYHVDQRVEYFKIQNGILECNVNNKVQH